MNTQKQFHALPAKERFEICDKPARRVFEAYCKEKGILSIELGIGENGPASVRCYEEKLLTKAPDMICKTNGGFIFLAELKGCGKNGLKIKCEDADAYKAWSHLKKLKIFINNSSSKSYAIVSMFKLLETIDYTAEKIIIDNKMFYNIPCSAFKWSKLPENIYYHPADNYPA